MTNKKILTLISLLLLFSFLMVGCELFPTKNQEPVITTTALPDAVVGTAYTATVEATDADGDTLTFSKVSGPTDMVISEAGVISGWTPAESGTEAVTVGVTDGTDSVSADFTITVNELVAELDHIVVLPETMPLVVKKSDTIKSVTAYYSDGSNAPVALGDCTYKSDDEEVATVEEVDGVVTVKALTTGTATITVSYTEEKITKTVYIEETDTVEVTVTDKVHNIDANLYYPTIEAAIKDARTGETIEVAAGTYEPDDTLTIDVKGLTLRSIDGPDTTIIAKEGGICINILAPHVTVKGFTVGGWYAIQVGVENNDTLDANYAVVTGNKLADALIFCFPGGDNSEISDNTIVRGGINLEGYPGTLTDVTITGNDILSLGNINMNGGDAVYTNILITGNTITESGDLGAVEIKGNVSDFTITHNNITDNVNAGILIVAECTWGLRNVINYNNIADNTPLFGINNLTTTLIDAEHNWWGDAGTGENAGSPEEEDNNGVSVDVDFTPWSTSEF